MRLAQSFRSLLDTWRLAPAALTVCALAGGCFVVQQVADRVEFVAGHTFGEALLYCFGLHVPLLARGFAWQLVTYIFLHGGWLHLGLNLLAVLLFGAGLEVEIGSRRFWTAFLLGGVLGGLGWAAVDAFQPYLRHLLAGQAPPPAYGHCIGASGGVFALVGAYAALFPQRETVLFVLVFPLRLRARSLALLLGVLTIAEAVLLQSDVAYAAHLAGGAAGYLYGLALVRRRRLFRLAGRG